MSAFQKVLSRFSLRDLLIISAMAALGIAIKPVITMLAHLISSPLMIPGGALAGGLYMMWLVVAGGLTQKHGAAALTGLIQSLLVTIVGIPGSHGLISIVSYTLPGLAVDLVLLAIRHKCCCLPCCFAAGITANLVGTACVNMIFFHLPLIPLLLSLAVAIFSGALGGLLAWKLLQALKKYHIGEKEQKRDEN